VYALHALWLTGKIPGVPIYIDSPLAVNATEVFACTPRSSTSASTSSSAPRRSSTSSW